jgi:hypothetical protein
MVIERPQPVEEQLEDPTAPNAESPAADAGPAAIERMQADLQSLRDAIALYLLAQVDQWKLAARRTLVGTGLAIVGLFAVAVLLGVSICLAVLGIAGGLGELFEGRYWLGQLVTGSVVLVVGGLGSWIFVRGLQASSRKRTIKRYARIHEQQAKSAPLAKDVRE